MVTARWSLALDISIHAPREGSDHAAPAAGNKPTGFLSTLPVRGATFTAFVFLAVLVFLSTLPVRGATDLTGIVVRPFKDFYPRSP